MIVYKVVEKGTRHCSNWTMFKAENPIISRKEILRDHPKLRKYLPRYLKGTTVKCVKGSIGILVFKTKEQAKIFSMSYGISRRQTKIIKVNGIGKLPRHNIITGCGGHIFNLLNGDMCSEPPTGTLFFKKVKVLE